MNPVHAEAEKNIKIVTVKIYKRYYNNNYN